MKRVAIALAVVLCFCVNASKSKAPAKQKSLITAKYAVLIDCETGDCLFDLQSKEACTPSSMTKLMTVYLLFSAISSGQISMEDEFPVSIVAQKMRGSRSFFQAGEKAKVEDLIRSIIVHSGNDACVVVAEGLAGDIDAFVDMMNEQAKKFGLQNTHFTNPNGLPDEEHYSCMADIACIARHIIQDFPQFYHYFSEKEFTVNGITQGNRNTLLGNSLGVDGLKTGKTDAGGYGIAVSAAKSGKRLIAVVNGCKSTRDRAQDASKLLSVGFRLFDSIRIAKAGEPITSVMIWLGDKDKINVCTHEDISISIPKQYSKTLKVEAKMKEPIDAPVKAGDRVGTLVYTYANRSKECALYAGESVNKAKFLERAQVTLKRLIFGDASVQSVVGNK